MSSEFDLATAADVAAVGLALAGVAAAGAATGALGLRNTHVSLLRGPPRAGSVANDTQEGTKPPLFTPESTRTSFLNGSAVRFSWPRFGHAPIAQLAEAADLKSAQCRFESDWGH